MLFLVTTEWATIISLKWIAKSDTLCFKSFKTILTQEPHLTQHSVTPSSMEPGTSLAFMSINKNNKEECQKVKAFVISQLPLLWENILCIEYHDRCAQILSLLFPVHKHFSKSILKTQRSKQLKKEIKQRKLVLFVQDRCFDMYLQNYFSSLK